VNLHHLEIFYHVARNGGICEAVRNFPYGIQQPAVSAQILQLEHDLGTKLFRRRPFLLTPAGEKLFAFVEPFFGNVGKLAGEIRGSSAKFIRIGASGPVLRHHLPNVLQEFRKTKPDLSLHLVEANAPQLIQALKKDELDLAVTTLHEPAAAGLSSSPLVELPLALLVPRSSRIHSADDLWKRDTIDEPLISLPAPDPIPAKFQRGLEKHGVDWAPAMVVSSLELIETYVGKGFGIGATVDVPGVKEPVGSRRIPLRDFEPLTVGAVWAGKQTALIRTFVEAFENYVRNFASAR
jgi:DNA-binding transcriptional LysR family regulator